VEEALTKLAEIERELARLRDDSGMRTSVATHMAWVPAEWERAAFDALEGLAERHPSRTILLLPEPDGEDGLEAEVSLHCFTLPGLEEDVCSEIIELRLRGKRTVAPASIVAPLLIADLPAFLRWRGKPPFGEQAFEQLIGVADRLIVDSTEWPDLPAGYSQLAEIFERVMVSDIAWARTSRWRRQLASLWPGIAEVERIHVRGTAAQAHLLAGWLRSRLGRVVALEHTPAEKLEGVDVDGEPAQFPPGEAPAPSDLLSDELDRYGRDRVYETAVGAA
jgi:hypothetical protein